MAGESKRWKEQIEVIGKEMSKIVPTSLVATAFCSQLGGMELLDRQELSKKWIDLVIELFKTDNEPLTELNSFKLEEYLYDIPTISSWQAKGLGKDTFSLQSASIAMNATKVPLLLDPQG